MKIFEIFKKQFAIYEEAKNIFQNQNHSKTYKEGRKKLRNAQFNDSVGDEGPFLTENDMKIGTFYVIIDTDLNRRLDAY